MTEKTYNWTTEKGAKVELTIASGMVKVNNYADGWNVETEEFERKVAGFSVNGASYEGELGFHKAHRTVTFQFNGQQAAVIIPAEIKEQIFAREIAQDGLNKKQDDEYDAHYNRVMRMMAE